MRPNRRRSMGVTPPGSPSPNHGGGIFACPESGGHHESFSQSRHPSCCRANLDELAAQPGARTVSLPFLAPSWKKLDLTKEQEKKLLDIREEYGKKVDDLERKISELATKQKQDREAILTDEQKKKLRAIQTGKEEPEKKP